MRYILIAIVFILSLSNASILDGKWHNSSSYLKAGQLKELDISGNRIKPHLQNQKLFKRLPWGFAIGSNSVKSVAWKMNSGILLVLIQYIDSNRLRVDVERSINSSGYPIIKRYTFIKGASKSKKFPFRGVWINPNATDGVVHKIKIKRKHGKIIIKAWKRCGKHKDCLIAKTKAKELNNRLYATLNDGVVKLGAILTGLDFDPQKDRFQRLEVHIKSYVNGVPNRQTIYLLRKHHH